MFDSKQNRRERERKRGAVKEKDDCEMLKYDCVMVWSFWGFVIQDTAINPHVSVPIMERSAGYRTLLLCVKPVE